MLIVGIILGAVGGFIGGLIFAKALLKDADRKYEEGDERWHQGTEEYRKAVRALELARDEKQQYQGKVRAAWKKLTEVLEREVPPLAPVIEQLGREI